MADRTLIDEIITLIHSESNNNPAPQYCEIIGNYEKEPYCDIKIEDTGVLLHKRTVGSTDIGLKGVICFLNGDLNDALVITSKNIDLTSIYETLKYLDENKSSTNHSHSQYLIEQDLIPYTLKNELLDLIYPVGAIYMSVNDVNPATLFGGEWEPIKDRFLLAKGDTYANASTGGSATVTLTANQSGIRAHNHGIGHTHGVGSGRQFVTRSDHSAGVGEKGSPSGTHHYSPSINKDDNWYGSANTSTQSTSTSGNNSAANAVEAHNNMPPYLAVNVWKRTK